MSAATGIVLIGQSSLVATHPLMATAVTIDLLFTIPIAYYFIIRKTSVPKITVVSVFFVCLLAAYAMVENEASGLLQAVTKFGVPAIELFVLGYLGFRIYRTRQAFADEAFSGRDLMERLRSAFVRELKPAAIARAAAFEVGTFIYAFIKWRRPAGIGFTYYKLNGSVSLLMVFLFLLTAETAVVHILLAMLSPTAAWIATAFSIYFAIQIVAHLKAMWMRLIVLTNDELLIRCGILGDAAIRLGNIIKIEKLPPGSDPTSIEVTMSPLGRLSKPNISLYLNEDASVYGVYGIEKRVSRIFFTVDEPDRFVSAVAKSL